MTTPRRRSDRQLAAALLAAVYAAGVCAVLFAPHGSPVATWWPAAGAAVALILLTPKAWWPALGVAIAVVSAAANVTGGRELDLSVLFGIANAAEALAAGWFLRRAQDRPRLESQDDFIRLVEAALLGGVTIATCASLSVVALGEGPFLDSWTSVFAAHAASTLVLVPVALSWHQRLTVRKPLELALQAALLAGVTFAVFSPHQGLSLTFVPLPFLVWAALRFDVRTVSWELAAFSVLITFQTAQGYGPIGGSYEGGRIDAVAAGALTQGYLLCAALMSLPLAIAVEQRRNLLTRISASERLFRRNFTESLVGMLLMRSEGTRLAIFDYNDTAFEVLGGDDEPLSGRPLDEILDAPEQLDLVVARMLAGNLEGWKAQTGLVGRPDARVNVSLSLLSGGAQPMFAAQLQDVTAEYDTRRDLEAAEKLTSATLDTTACIILVTDLEGTIVRANSATTGLTGFTAEELVGRPVWETTLAPATAGDVDDLFMWPNQSGTPVTRETDATTKTGEKLHIVWNNNIVPDEQGRPAYAVMTGIDVTAERTASGMTIQLLEASITTALIGVDNAGRISAFNAGAQNLLGYHYLDMIGEPFTRLLDPEELLARTGAPDVAAAFASLTDAIGPDGETRPEDWAWVAGNGQRHTVSMTLSAMVDTAGAPMGFLCIGRDVTEQRHGQEMLVAALDKERTAVLRLRQLDAAKNEFVSTVSHELRTPVTSIIGYTEMLADGSVVDPDPAQLPLLNTIARNGERLIVICNDLLTLSGLDSPAALWERERIDLGSILAFAEEAILPLLKGRDLSVTFDAPDGPVVVLGDRAQLERVALNLLSNAVKFTEDGGKIRCTLEVGPTDACLVVSDSGIGIPEEEQGRLFQKFFRSSTAQERAIQGTGLGLSIVAAIVAAHGGRIGVESGHLQGTTFSVCLPLKVAARPM